jgi:competence protein ComEC
VLIALALGILDAAVLTHPARIPDARHAETLRGTVLESAPLPDGAFEIVLRLEDGTRVSATLPQAEPVGAALTLRGTLAPFDEARNPGEPAPRELATERGLDARILHPRNVAAEGIDARDAGTWFPRARAWAAARLRDRLPEPQATILAGAMWGEKSALPPDLREEFQATGTTHVLVTAGLHLGVVAALAVALLSWCGVGRVTASLAAIAIVWLYAALSGDHLPAVRAATMISFALLARATGRTPFSPNALAAAAIVVTALRPAAVVSLSFALSFSCVAAILLYAKPLGAALERLQVPQPAREAIALTLATQLGTWPLTAYGFLVIAPFAPLANAFVVPAIGVAMLVGFVELAAAPLPFIATLAANIETSLLDWIVAVVRVVASLPGAHIVATPPPPWTIALYDGALAGAAWLLHAGRRRAALATVLAATLLCLEPPRVPASGLRVTAIDVGQADALLIQTPRGHALLVDGGGRLERGPDAAGNSVAEAVGERTVVPFLIRSGIHHLDAILLSHPHGDHAGGLPPVLRTLGTDAFADSGQAYPGHAYHDALDVLHKQHTPLLEPRGGNVWRTDDGVTLRFYRPTSPYITGSRSDINSNSLVFRLEYGAFRMLFTGDAGTETEERLLQNRVDLRADVLKVGHHGSAYGTTPEFVHAVSPRAAVISVGRNNLFGHPAPATLAVLRNADAKLYRTDQDGAVTIRSDGMSFSVAPFLRQ